jgi:hypothetical protein
MRVLVTGGRSYANKMRVWSTLNQLLQEHGDLVVIEGGADGADAFARAWCARARRSPERRDKVHLITEEADWDRHGKAAGPIRNARMLLVHKPDLVVAFSGGRGTANCVEQARKLGVEVREIEDP